MNDAERKLADVLMQSGYSFSEITGILCSIQGFLEHRTYAVIADTMGTIAVATLMKYKN